MSELVLQAKNLSKAYYPGQYVLHSLDFEVEKGDCVALLGASGSGKSTLLHNLALLDQPDEGQVFVFGKDSTKLTSAQKAQLRLTKLGFVFQFHHLIPELNAVENVALPASMMGEDASVRAKELLSWVGLSGLEERYPWQMSGGEQQRLAIARALINKPEILYTDEATGNLDSARSQEIVALLQRINKELGTTVLSVTHDEQQAKTYSKRYFLSDGKVELIAAKD